MFFVSHLYFGRVKRPSSGWMAVTSITHHYNMITNKFENLHALQRKINTRALLPDARSSRPILAVKKVAYIQALRLNTVQPIGPLVYWIKRYRHLFASAIIRLRCIRPKHGCLVLSQAPDKFSFSGCKFRVRKCKESTARVVMWRQMGITNSFTMEATFCGANFGDMWVPDYCLLRAFFARMMT